MASGFSEKTFIEKTNVSRETMENIKIYATHLTKWQKNINLVSGSTIESLWERHFYDSYQLKDYFEGAEQRKLRILDIGSGAGFPGLLLSMLDIGEFHMVESNGKKCAFMRQVIRDTNSTAIVHAERVEEMDIFPVDYIISRACAPLDKLLRLAQNFIQEDVICLFLKGQTASEEIEEAQKNWSFHVEKFTSKSEDTGVILKVSHIKALR